MRMRSRHRHGAFVPSVRRGHSRSAPVDLQARPRYAPCTCVKPCDATPHGPVHTPARCYACTELRQGLVWHAPQHTSLSTPSSPRGGGFQYSGSYREEGRMASTTTKAARPKAAVADPLAAATREVSLPRLK